MQAGRRAEMSVSPKAQLRAAAAPSSSLPKPMGNSPSKPFLFKRAFTRRKKPDSDRDAAHHDPQRSQPPAPPPPPPPPPPPKSAPPQPNTQLHASLAPSPNCNRASIIPMTDAIESAVNFMATNDCPPRSQRDLALPSLPTSSFSQHASTQPQREAKRPRAKSDSEGILLETADKRKSDSTISHSTIRPGANGPRSSRPVSMAESFQSTHTIVPGNGASSLGGVNKRLSAVDGDLGSLQEDDDSSFKSIDEPRLVVVPTRGDSLPTHSLIKQKRRSMSLNIPSTPPLEHLTPSVSAADLKHPSYSICEGFYNQPPLSASMTTTSPSPSSSSLWTGATPLPDVNRHLPHVPTHNVSTFTYPTRRPVLNHPPTPASFRQTAVSITSSFAPAAGLAKRAVERVRGALGHMGSNASQGGGGSESISSASISSVSGYSSSASISSTAPSAFPSEWGVLNPGRIPSKQGSAACSGSMHAVNIDEIKKKSQREGRKDKRMRKPGAHGTSHSFGSVSTCSSDRDGYSPSGPLLGVCLRAPVKRVGIVFRRELASCVRETAIWVGSDRSVVDEDGGGRGLLGRPELKIYEKRMLPAIVVRCAQHMLIWGVQEEGLFRVPGRAAHVTRLRTEFDTGADYDMSGCTPGDLDPHAVASVFKAYLRELPEHILTQKLSQYFDAVIEQESSATCYDPPSSPASPIGGGMRRGIGLPSSQKPPSAQSPSSTISSLSSSSAAFSPHNLRKPPSLSTLAMPSFNGMKPPSHSLISALRSLIAKLPVENRDLLRTVVELIRATAREFKMTRMPLGNLLVPFLPTLSVSAQLLRVLCEEESVWEGLVDNEGVLDVKRETMVLDIKREDKEGDEEGRSEGEEEEEEAEGGEEVEEEETNAQRRWTVVNRPEIPTVYLDSRSEASSASVASSALVSLSRDTSTTESSVITDDMSSFERHSEMKRGEEEEWEGGEEVLSSSVESSISTPLTSSAQSSMNDLGMDALDTVKDLSGKEVGGGDDEAEKLRIQVFESVSPDVLLSRSPVVGEPRRLAISNPLPYISIPPSQQPMTPSPAMSRYKLTLDKSLPQTPLSPKRRSIPTLSFPSLSTFSQRAPSSNGSSGSEPTGPGSSVDSLHSSGGGGGGGGGRNGLRGLHMHKPSLKMLFAKRSAGSLNHKSYHSNSSRELVMMGIGKVPLEERSASSLSAPILHSQQNFAVQQQQLLQLQLQLQQQQLRLMSMPSVHRYEGSGSSDSSVSTPVSAVTAPGGWGDGSGRGSGVELPPVLDTPIKEGGPSLRMELGLDVSPPDTAGLDDGRQAKEKEEEEEEKVEGSVKGKERAEKVKTLVGKTPIADRYGSTSVLDLRMSGQQEGRDESGDGGSSSSEESDEDDDGDDDDEGMGSKRRTIMGRGRATSFSSQTSSINHLGLLEDDRDEDWTQSVLMDLDIGVRR